MSGLAYCMRLAGRRLVNGRKVHGLRFFRTQTNNPYEMGLSDVGKLYEIPMEDVEKLNIKTNAQSYLARQLDTLGECVLMCRTPFLETLNCMKAVRPTFPALRLVLWGKFGTGKTITLNQTVHAAFFAQWVVVQLRDAMQLTRGVKEVEMSTWKQGRINDPLGAVFILSMFKQQNVNSWKSLVELKTHKTYEWTKADKTPEGRPITEIVEMGISAPFLASDCVGALFKELRLHSSTGACRLLVAVDNANALYGKTLVKRADRTFAKPGDLTLVHHYRKFLGSDWSNGMVVLVADKKEVHSIYDTTTVPLNTPLELFGEEGFEAIDPFIPVQTSLYSKANAIYDYYKSVNWIASRRGRSDEGRKQLMYISGFNPFFYERICAFC